MIVVNGQELLLLLSHFSRVRLCATPKTAAHQAPPSLGFSRQELWSGLPFSSPMDESEKWKWSRSVMSDSVRPHGLQPTRLLRPWDFPGKSPGVGCRCLKYANKWLYFSNLGRHLRYNWMECDWITIEWNLFHCLRIPTTDSKRTLANKLCMFWRGVLGHIVTEFTNIWPDLLLPSLPFLLLAQIRKRLKFVRGKHSSERSATVKKYGDSFCPK